MKLSWVLLTVMALLAGSCASGKKVTVTDNNWGNRIGTYTYGEALAELGEPNLISESSEGKIAEWFLQQSPAFSFGFGFSGTSYSHHTAAGSGAGITVSPPPGGESLRLRFDQDGKLVEWTRVRY
jgi:hypothetical protein